MKIENYTFKGEGEGPHLLVTGAIHGNEVCGPIAINWLKDQIDAGLINIKSGALTIIPLCNQKAYDLNQRYYKRDLNRHFYPKANPTTYEDELHNELGTFFKEADILLDIHSYHTEGGRAFMFFRPNEEKDREFASMLGVHTYLYGFGEAYAKAGIEKSEKESMGTREYILTQGGYGVTLECGYHKNPESVEIAKRAIIGALHHLGVADIDNSLKDYIPEKTPINNDDFYGMVNVTYKEQEGSLGNYNHFDEIKEGQLLAEYNDAAKILAPDDGYIIFPNYGANIGDEWFYLAKKGL